MWLYLTDSRCSQALAESILPSKNGSTLLPTAKLNPTVKVSSCRECKKGICPKHQFGTTYEHYQEMYYMIQDSYITQSTSSTEGFPVKIFQLQDAKKAWKESEAVFFSKYYELSMKSKLPSYSLKMSQTLGLKEQNEFAKSWPKEGMIVDGVCYPLQMWERGIKGNGGSYWATPNTMDWMPLRSKEALDRQFATTRKGRTKPANLREQIHPECWPTPTARGTPDCPSKRRRHTPSLESAVKMLPTPAARDWKDNASPSEYNRNTPTLATHAGGSLSPQFVELLMMYPLHWTLLQKLPLKQKIEQAELKPLAIP